jgi:ABC-2 type transport system ATP-binding protein
MSEVLHEHAATGVPVIFSSHQLELVERISDRVGIIQRGHLVACGTVDELSAGGPERYWVDAPAAKDGWASLLSGVRVVRTDGTRWLLELDGRTPDQAVLQAALSTGPVHEFRRDVPSLLDIFREALTEDRVAATA